MSTDAPSKDGTTALFETEDAYVSDLLSYSLERLNKEPELLKADTDRIERHLQEVAVKHYRSFITAAECVKTVHAEVNQVNEHLKELLEGLPALEQGCREFSQGAEQITTKRALNKQMLNCHGTLLDLLEVPQLMDTCVRNGNYDEALDLEAFAAKLAVLHSNFPVVVSLKAEVKAISQSMLQQLLHRLQSSIHLPECLRLIGYLRRMAVFSEREMRQNFLQCREAWFTVVVEELDRANAYDFLKRLTDCHRMHLFDVVMQYRAIFSDDTSQSEDSTHDGGLLYSWGMHRVCAYLREVELALPAIAEGSALASVLDHCMYCGLSLGRVGLDFRALLPDLFQSSVCALVTKQLDRTVDVLEQSMEQHRWVALPAVSSENMLYGGAEEGAGPPYSLMEHPPVAVFTNGVLAALNELRHCAPVATRSHLAAALHECLRQGASTLSRYHATHTLRDSDATLFHALVRAYSEVAAPYLATCFGRIYTGDSALVDSQTAMLPLKDLMSRAAAAAAEEEVPATTNSSTTLSTPVKVKTPVASKKPTQVEADEKEPETK
eukprot:CAMPEP_0118930398 /NCGR_PEP_ID=MMETSP1169-20130426/7097_1 /TAXON_ID=36882 /ORGANISM="Pyramimonas obovata, Strain CCMP722" /LENGTH=550 /DNA_ID=CAMNT_0006872749 /DNA_START=127 /DNA_END=1779 /DNA_ORIENTATION=+